MTRNAIREVIEREPFQPFLIHLADGRDIPVVSREFMASAPSGRTIVVFQPDDKMHIIDLLLVTDVEVATGNGRKKRPQKRDGG